MKIKSIPVAIAMLIAAPFMAPAASVASGPIVNPANGHTYYLLTQDNWSNSESFALTLGGHLASIDDAAENQWIYNTFYPLTGISPTHPEHLWIGFYNPLHDGNPAHFIWTDGTPVSYTDWYPGEPSNSPNPDPNGEYVTEMRSPNDAAPLGSWNDVSNVGSGDIGTLWGVVEVVPEPTALSLALLAAGFGFAVKRRR